MFFCLKKFMKELFCPRPVEPHRDAADSRNSGAAWCDNFPLIASFLTSILLFHYQLSIVNCPLSIAHS